MKSMKNRKRCGRLDTERHRTNKKTQTDSARGAASPHWNKNALVTIHVNVTTNFFLARTSVDLLTYCTSAAKKKNRPFYLGKSPHSGEEKIQPQQPCPTIIPVWLPACHSGTGHGQAGSAAQGSWAGSGERKAKAAEVL